jgi:hypothetical protein
VEGLQELVSYFRRTIDYPPKKWLSPRAHDDIQEAQCLAAFLILPGVICYYKDKNRDILKLLEAAHAAPQPYLFLLAAAQDLIHAGIAQHGVDRTHVRSQNQMVDMVDDLCHRTLRRC